MVVVASNKQVQSLLLLRQEWEWVLNNEIGRKGVQGKGCEAEGNPDIAPQTSKECIGNYVRQMRHLPYFHLWVYNQITPTSPTSGCVYRMI